MQFFLVTVHGSRLCLVTVHGLRFTAFMSPERWKQIEEVFQSALDLPESERGGFIASACAGDDALREQVEALIKQYEQAGNFIEAPAVAVAGFTGSSALNTTLEGADEDPMAGRRIGSYRIVRE